MKLDSLIQGQGLTDDSSGSDFAKRAGTMVTTLLCAIVLPANASVVYVNANQTNNVADGTSWTTAFSKVQQGIEAATDGDAVWVAAGTYFENITNQSGVALYGGFAGTELSITGRSWTANPTILDGRGSNSVVRITAGTNTTRLDGFVLRNGSARRGGGIYCVNASPEIVNNVIAQNLAISEGGGIFCENGSPLIAANLIQGNVVSSNGFAGAAISCLNSGPKIQRNRIVANKHLGTTPYTVAGLSFEQGQFAEISGNLLFANTATSAFGGPDTVGGISLRSVGYPRVINNTIAWCLTASGGTGGIYLNGTSMFIANNIVAYCSGGVFGTAGTFKNNCVFGNGQNYVSSPDQTGLNGNISVDPQLATNAFYPNAHLLATSPCRDAGDSGMVAGGSYDIDGDPRVLGGAVEIGADEFNGFTPLFTPRIVRVSISGNDANDGSVWTNAKRTVQAAINACTLGGGQVWVAAGIYDENLVLLKFVQLYGGFAGTETSIAERDWTANGTILDGGQRGRVITATDLQGWNAIDGFVIRNGRANVGAGIYCSGSAPIITQNLISNNVATPFNPSPNGLGGGIYCEAFTAGSSPTIISNVFYANRGVVGGGIACSGYVLSSLIANNRFEANVAEVIPPTTGFANGGGGIFLYRSAKPIIEGNYFLKNVATNVPGSFSAGEGGAICVDHDATPKILNNAMIGNLATSSKGFYFENGGGVLSKSATAKVVNNLIAFGSSGISTVRFSWDESFTNVLHNCVFGNGTNYLRIPDLTGTNGNISAVPLLATTNDFHLSMGSPCIDAGTNGFVSPGARDLDGQIRVFGPSVDIGADEYGSVLPTTLLLSLNAEQAALKLAAEPGRTYVFEVSSNLVNWTAFSTNQAANWLLELEGVLSGDMACQFYRSWVMP